MYIKVTTAYGKMTTVRTKNKYIYLILLNRFNKPGVWKGDNGLWKSDTGKTFLDT